MPSLSLQGGGAASDREDEKSPLPGGEGLLLATDADMKRNRFQKFLKKHRPFGGRVDWDFVDDALEDSNLPDPESFEQLALYLKKHAVTMSVFVAAYRVWHRYASATRKLPVQRRRQTAEAARKIKLVPIDGRVAG